MICLNVSVLIDSVSMQLTFCACSQEEFDAEVRRLGALCEARTKELNRVRLELRDTAHALSALAVAFQRWDLKLER